MTKMLTFLLAISYAFGPATPPKPRIPAELILVVHGHPPLAKLHSPLGAQSSLESTLVFMDEPLELSAVLDLPTNASANDVWWHEATVSITDDAGTNRNLASSNLTVIEDRLNGKLVAGRATNFNAWSQTLVRFRLDPLPPGDYVVRASVMFSGRTLKSSPAVFHVRRGDEDKSVERTYLLLKLGKTRSFEEYRTIILRLLEIEPDDSQYYEMLAERSLNEASLDESLKWFKLAHASVERGIARVRKNRGDKLTKEEIDAQEQSLLNVSLFEKIYPYYKDHERDMRLVILGQSGLRKSYAWQARDGHIIGLIDLNHPSIVQPLRQENRRE